MLIYFIRHGESETNLNIRLTGWYDTPLTEKGIEDAKKAGEFLKNVHFDKVFTSDLKRAKKTADIALPGYSYEETKLLREINVGSLSNTPHSDISKETKKITAKIGYSDFGGESRDDFISRISLFMKQLENSNYNTVAVFCHAGWMRAMLDIVTGLYLPRQSVYLGNCAITIYKLNGTLWQLNGLFNIPSI